MKIGIECLPRVRVNLRELLLVKRHWLASLVEYEEARAGSTLVNATNEDFFFRRHCGCAVFAGVSVCDLAESRSYGNSRSNFLGTCLCSSEPLRFKASSSREAIARRRQQCGYTHHRPRGATCEKNGGAADEGMPCCCCPRPRDHRLAPAVLCMSALRFPPSPLPRQRTREMLLGPAQMTRSLVCGMAGVSTMHGVVMRRT